MKAYGTDTRTQRIVYVIVNFDNRTHEYADRYKMQIDQFMAYIKPPDVEVHFDIKPAFYNARA